MKHVASVLLCLAMLFLAAAASATATPASRGETIVVASAADSGPGTLRRALLDAQYGDTITFDAAVFRPTAPVTITLTSELPHIHQGNLTVDASNAGVILDGSNVPGDWVGGLQIVSSDGNTIRGLQVSNFSGAGIALSGDAKHNMIGGDLSIGAGPFGQGNLASHNGLGIGLWSDGVHGASLNTVTGNLIGTDVAGAGGLGNHGSGISISEGANGNIIGPHNIIAHNDGHGIEIMGSDSLRNTITQNSIHGNADDGISLVEGGNTGLLPPTVLDFDLAAGTVSGFACPNCTVEIFSDSSDEGEVYEGQAMAESNGVFALTKGVPFTELHLTSSATDPDGNTSEFSTPTAGTHRTLSLQQGNHLPLTPLSSKPSQSLPDNHIGPWFEDYGRFHDTDFVYRNGFKRMRIGSLAGPGQGWLTIINSESLSDEVDETISEYADNGVEIVLILASGAGLPAWTTTFQSEEEIEQYLEYVRFAVTHFRGRIHHYEVWNEPGFIAVPDYANVVERVVEAIRPIDPDAKIIIGAIQADMVNGYPGYGEFQRFTVDMRYLNELLVSGVVHLVDGISWHPFYDNIPNDPYYQGYPELVASIQELATQQGFQGEYFADEILWHTVDEEDWDNGPPVSQQIAAKYYTRTIAEHRGLGINVTINTFFQVPHVAPIRHLCNTLAGAEQTDTTLSVASERTNIRHYEFALPYGHKLVALWTNDEAVEDDPGVSATLTIPGSSALRVAGVDVLNGFEQGIEASEEDGNLVIRNLLVKDYPIILRLSPTRHVFLPVGMNGRGEAFGLR